MSPHAFTADQLALLTGAAVKELESLKKNHIRMTLPFSDLDDFDFNSLSLEDLDRHKQKGSQMLPAMVTYAMGQLLQEEGWEAQRAVSEAVAQPHNLNLLLWGQKYPSAFYQGNALQTQHTRFYALLSISCDAKKLDWTASWLQRGLAAFVDRVKKSIPRLDDSISVSAPLVVTHSKAFQTMPLASASGHFDGRPCLGRDEDVGERDVISVNLHRRRVTGDKATAVPSTPPRMKRKEVAAQAASGFKQQPLGALSTTDHTTHAPLGAATGNKHSGGIAGEAASKTISGRSRHQECGRGAGTSSSRSGSVDHQPQPQPQSAAACSSREHHVDRTRGSTLEQKWPAPVSPSSSSPVIDSPSPSPTHHRISKKHSIPRIAASSYTAPTDDPATFVHTVETHPRFSGLRPKRSTDVGLGERKRLRRSICKRDDDAYHP